MANVIKYIDSAALTSTRFIIVGSYNSGMVRVGNLNSDGSHTWLTSLLDVETGPSVNFRVAALTDTQFVLAYSDGVTGYGTVRVGNYDSTVVWDTPETLISSSPVSLPVDHLDVIKMSSVGFLVGYVDPASHEAYVKVGQLSSGSVMWLTTSDHLVAPLCSYIYLLPLTNFKFLVSYTDSSTGVAYVRAGTWSGGDNLSWITSSQQVSANSSTSIKIINLTDTRFVATWYDSITGKGYVKVGELSSSIDWVTADVEFSSSECSYIDLARLSDLYFALVFKDISSTFGMCLIGYYDGFTVEWSDTPVPFRHSDVSHLSLTSFDEHTFAIFFSDDGFSGFGAVTVGHVGSILSTTTSTSTSTTTTGSSSSTTTTSSTTASSTT